MELPITVVPGTNPPIFRWTQTTATPIGQRKVEHEGSLPATIETELVHLIGITKQLMFDNAALRGEIAGMQERAKKATTVVETSPQPTSKRSK